MSTPGGTPALGEEYAPEGEDKLIEAVTRVSLEKLRSDSVGRGDIPVPRGQHPKSHGCVRAEFIVESRIPPELKHGIFHKPRVFTALVRFSNGLSQDDRQGDLHGMAIKLLDVEYDKESEQGNHAQTQDFVLADQPIFFIRDAADYVPFSEQVLKLGRAPAWWKILVVVFRAFILRDRRWRLILQMRTKPADLLGQRYWSQTPYKLDRLAVKYSVRPAQSALPPAAASNSKDRLRESLVAHLARSEASFDFLVQVQNDPLTMPVEDPTIAWDEVKSPPIKVATLRIPPQQFDTPAVRAFDENLSFTPWHALGTHRPLGGVNRCRRKVYDAISAERHLANYAPRREPTPADLPADLAPRPSTATVS